MTIKAIQDEIVEEFSMFDDWDERFQYVIDLGKNLPLIADNLKVDDNTITGCQSKVWLFGEKKSDEIIFTADSDAIITKGLIAMLINLLNQQTPKDVHHAQLFFIETIGLHQHLSPSRSNGFAGMVQQMKQYAHVFLQKQLAGNVVGE